MPEQLGLRVLGGGGVGVPFTKPHVVPFQGLRVGESGLRVEALKVEYICLGSTVTINCLLPTDWVPAKELKLSCYTKENLIVHYIPTIWYLKS